MLKLKQTKNALETAKEFKEANDDVQVIFDGAGTQWATQFAQPDHRLAGLYDSIADKVTGVCSYCANAFHVKEEVKASGAKLLDELAGGLYWGGRSFLLDLRWPLLQRERRGRSGRRQQRR